MYSNDDFIACPVCGTLGKYAPNIFDQIVFYHKVFSKNLGGYYTFTEDHA